MDQDTNKLIENQLKTLPQELQRAIAVTPWRNLVGSIAKSNNLDQPKGESLEMETLFVVYGFESQNDFVSNLMRELSINMDKAEKIAGEINVQIFLPILAKANEFSGSNPVETMQTSKEKTPEQTQLAPTVVVEKHTDLPMIINRPKTALTFEERKRLVPNIQSKSNYSGGIDPYREKI